MNTIKFCSKCGAPLSPDEKFCGKCGANVAQMEAESGTPVQPQQNTNYAQPQQNFAQPQQPQQNFAQPQNYGGAAVKKSGNIGDWFKNHTKLVAIIAAAIVLIVAAIIVLCNIFKYQVIDAKELIKVEFSGVEKAGTASADLNCYSDSKYLTSTLSTYFGSDSSSSSSTDSVSKYFATDQTTLLSAYTKAKDYSAAVLMRSALLQKVSGKYSIVCRLDKTTGLKNGDVVKCTVTYDEAYLKKNKIKLKNTEFEATVSGLQEGTEVTDFFDGVKVTFSGYDGSGVGSIDSTGAKYPFIRYSTSYSDNKNLSNGSKLTVTATLRYVSSKKTAGSVTTFKYSGKYYAFKSSLLDDDNACTKDFTVSDLGEAKEVDVFKDITFNVSSAFPVLKISSVNSDSINPDIKSYVSYSVVDSSNVLKMGDTFKVRCYVYSTAKDSGLKFTGGDTDSDSSSSSYIYKTFKVDDTYPSYVMKAADAAAAAKTVESVFKSGLDRYETNIIGHSYAGDKSLKGNIKSIKSKTLVEGFLLINDKLTGSESPTYFYGTGNRLALIYKYTVSTEKGTDTLYCVTYVNDAKSAYGTYTCSESTSSYSNFSYSTSYGTLSNAEKSLKAFSGMTATKISKSTYDSAKAKAASTDSSTSSDDAA